jgi:anti-sigma regulatory factor (Ser/Thr protein kinase)
MTRPHDCSAMRSLLAELATGAASGHERAWALGHVTGCPTCRAELDELAKVADGLLRLAPPAEPPPEFESAVLKRLGMAGSRTAERRRRYSRRMMLAVGGIAAALLLVSGASATVVYRQGEADRALADQYRQTLSIANGRYLRAARLTTAAGEQTGTVFLYQGSPSWLLVSISSAPTDGRYEIRVRDRGGVLRSVGACQVKDRSGTTGYRLDIAVAHVAEIQLTQGSQVRLTATLPN